MRTRTVICRPAMTIVAVAAAVVIAGCSSAGSSTATGSASLTSPNAASSAPSYLAAAEATVRTLLAGDYGVPPATAPAPARGKSVWYLSCGESISICAAAGAGVVESGNLLGWKTTIFDTKSDPSLVVNGVRQAIAARADAIVLYGLTCADAKQPLADARKAGIKIVGIESFDCSQTTQGPVGSTGQPPEFNAQVTYVQGDYAHWIVAYGRAQADWLIARTAGKANVISFIEDDEPAIDQYQAAYLDELRKCSGCSAYVVHFGLPDFGPGLQQKAQQALLKDPAANGVWVPYDGVITSGVGAAIQSSGRTLAVMGGEGEPANLTLVREGGRQQTAGIGIVPGWEGWSAVDCLIRLFDGRRCVGSGIGLQIYEAGHNVPASGGYMPPVDFKASYRKAWGLG